MSTPSELDELKNQLNNLLENRLGHITPKDQTLPAAESSTTEQRPEPAPELTTIDQEELNNPEIGENDAAPVLDDDADVRVTFDALNRIAAPFVLYNDNYRLIFANQMARKLWPETIYGVESGLSILDATANQIRVLLPTSSEEEIEGFARATVARHGSDEPHEVMASGDRWYRLHHDKVEGEYICAMGVDITNSKRREVQLREARESADQANVAKSAFLARMSHEIKTPLNAIVGMADALMEDVSDKDTRETLEYIVTAAEGLTHVLGQTLDHAKLMSEKVVLELQNHNLRETLQKVSGMWKKPSAAKNLKLKIHVHQNVPKNLVFDRFRLQQCLNNLLSNAVKFTDSGHITVASKIIEKPNATSTIAIVVQDTGVGMDEEACARVFNAYEQAEKSTSRKFGGTGLGLSITKQLVEAMGGSISVQSDAGRGTAFLMTIPADLEVSADPIEAIAGGSAETELQQSEAKPDVKKASGDFEQTDITSTQETEDTEQTGSSTPFEGLSVLCVEDNPVNHAVIKKLIGKQVKSISFALNGEEGLKALNTQNFDVVLMDIHMPVMDGIEATLKIRGSDKPWADVIIIAVTADPDFQYQRVCRNIGMNDAIGKPVKRQDILDSIARSLDVLKETHAQRVELPLAV